MKRRLSVLLVLLVASSAFAQEARVLLDREEMLSAARGTTRETYPNAEDVVVGHKALVTYNADGTYVQWHEEYVKILTEKSKRRVLVSHDDWASLRKLGV